MGPFLDNLLQALFLGFPIIVLSKEDPLGYFFIMSSLVFLLCMSVLSLIFVPKIMYLKGWHIEQEASQGGGNVHISGEGQDGLKYTESS